MENKPENQRIKTKPKSKQIPAKREKSDARKRLPQIQLQSLPEPS